MRPRAVLGEIDALPGAERQRAVEHWNVQRHAVEHRLHVAWHVIGAFRIVHPAGIGGARRSSAVARSTCTSGSAFSWITSDAEVWRRKMKRAPSWPPASATKPRASRV